RLEAILNEVAWSSWEFAKTEDGTDWYVERAYDFLTSYWTHRHEVHALPFQHIVSLIRWHLREQIWQAHALAEQGLSWDEEYMRQEIVAIRRLKAYRL